MDTPHEAAKTPPPVCGHPLNTIYFYLTAGCNLRCKHCWLAPKYEGKETKQPTLNVDVFADILDQAKAIGAGAVKLTGGEPFIHPHIDKLLELIAARGLRLIVETNGVELTPARIERVRRCKDPFVSISLDSADAKVHEWLRGVEGCFATAVANARHCVEAGIRPQIIVSVMKRNAGDLKAIVAFAEELGAQSVKFNAVVPSARGERLHQAGETLSIAELVQLDQWIETDLKRSASIPVRRFSPLAFRPLSAIFGEKGDAPRCGILNILGVLHSGHYALCGIGSLIPELILGHAKTDRLEAVWNNSPFLNELRAGLPKKLKGVCGECIMKAQCLGACVANNYYRHRDTFAAFWFCDMARDAGLFPQDRLRENSARGTGSKDRAVSVATQAS